MKETKTHPYRCSHVICVDGEAAFLHGPIIAVGAVVFDVERELVVDEFAARLAPPSAERRWTDPPASERGKSEYEKNKAVADAWVLSNVYPILENDKLWTAPLRHSYARSETMLDHFFIWWACWSRTVSLLALTRECAGPSSSYEASKIISETLERSTSVGVQNENDALTFADWAYPVEHKLFARALERRKEWGLLGPKPIHEIASLRLADSLCNPMLHPTSASEAGGTPHDPAFDAYVSGKEAIALLKRLKKGPHLGASNSKEAEVAAVQQQDLL